MNEYEEQILFARFRKTLAPWKAWATKNGLRAKIVQPGNHQNRIYRGMAYPFKLLLSGFSELDNQNELLDKLDKEFSWENHRDGFAIGEKNEQQEVVKNVLQKGDWSPKKRSKKRRAA